MERKTIFTIGHSTHSTHEFMKILKAHQIELVVDVRQYPGSRHCPQFGKARLRQNLDRNGIGYLHLEVLGGRRRADKQSDVNAGWRNPHFRGYADYMQTQEFKDGLKKLMHLAQESRVAIMCAEALPWRCHRSMIGDALLNYHFRVWDIFSDKIIRPHKLTAFAEVHGKKITYPGEAA